MIDLVKPIPGLTNSDLESEIRGQASNEIFHQFMSAEKSHQLLGREPQFTLDEELQAMID